MNEESSNDIHQIVDRIYRTESRRVFATLVRLLGDFDLAEEAMHDAFALAVEQWAKDGVPANPRSWLVSAGRFKAIDTLRRRGRFDLVRPEVADRFEQVTTSNAMRANEEIEDDRLRLIFTCCHPAIAPQIQVPLTLREVCGLTTEEIAGAFLTSSRTMAQRIVRGKSKIRDAGIPIAVPDSEEFVSRLESVLVVIYLVFSEGYSATAGNSVTRSDLSGEAIRLGRLLVELLPDPEAMGLLALMLLQESRRDARVDAAGDLILLDAQDRSLWDSKLIAEGLELVERAISTRRFATYTLQASIAAVHARATNAVDTNWSQIVALYDALLSINASPVVELNRAVAIAMRDEPQAGLELVDGLLDRGELAEYHLAHATRADLCRRLGRLNDARSAYEKALSLARQEPEIRFLQRRLSEL